MAGLRARFNRSGISGGTGHSGQTALLFELTGDQALDAKLKTLDRDLQRKVAGQGVNAGLGVLLKAARGAAPNKRLKRALGKRNKKGRISGVQEGKIGLNVGKKGEKQFPHAHLLVLGTQPRYTGQRTRRTKTGTTTKATGNTRAFRGRIKPSAWFQAAIRGAMSLAAQVATNKAWAGIRALANR